MKNLFLFLLLFSGACNNGNAPRSEQILEAQTTPVNLPEESVADKPTADKMARDTVVPGKQSDPKLQLAAEKYSPDSFQYHSPEGNKNVLLVISKTSLANEAMLFYDQKKEKILHTFDIKSNNPYLPNFKEKDSQGILQQLIGYNYEIPYEIKADGQVVWNRTALKNKIPALLYDHIPENFTPQSIHLNTYTFQSDTTAIVLKYGIDLLPPDEILEHLTYPALSTIIVLDTDGKEIKQFENLPFVVTDAKVSTRKKYLLLTHQENITAPDYSTNEEDWEHCFSVYNIETGKLCFTDCIEGECFVDKNKNGIAYFQCHDNIQNDNIDFYSIALDEGKSILFHLIMDKNTPDGVLNYTPDGIEIRDRNILIKKYLYTKSTYTTSLKCQSDEK